MIYIFDLDGTLADCTHRQHFIHGEKKDWDAFYAACDRDKLIRPVADILSSLERDGHYIWIWTGRSDEVKEKTREWLRYNRVYTDSLRMRPAGDHSPDHLLKEKWLNEVSLEQRAEIDGVFEDRSRVVEMWRANGFTCYQVAKGDF